MNIPLDRLYNYLDDLCGNSIIIYRFSPHGSKKLTDLCKLRDYTTDLTVPFLSRYMICHDQEPLNFDLYTSSELLLQGYRSPSRHYFENTIMSAEEKETYKQLFGNLNLRMAITPLAHVYDRVLLLHSEKNSLEQSKYHNHGFEGVYWWAHAVIARDWYRYAQVDQSLRRTNPQVEKDFLIYNRAWTGTREYRLKFAERLLQLDLLDFCRTKFQPHCDGKYYQQHLFQNPAFEISNDDLENYFDVNNADANSSADYVAQDYTNTNIEVVLETLFDDSRSHITEKSLRPIACGHPFILVATQNSLEYLKSYGFKTFSPWINEDYDKIANSAQRLETVLEEMNRIAKLPAQHKQQVIDQCQQIAEFNKQVFFSKEFFNRVIGEFIENLSLAQQNLEKHRTGHLFRSYIDFCNSCVNNQGRLNNEFEFVVKWLDNQNQ